MAVTIDGSGEITGLDEINNIAVPATSFGKVIQVVEGKSTTQTATTSTSYVDTAVSATITPSSASNKIFVIASCNGMNRSASDTFQGVSARLIRGATQIALIGVDIGYTATGLLLFMGGSTVSIVDSPASTSATTYKIQVRSGNGASEGMNGSGETSSIILMEIAA
jgi:hypothetical protein